MESRCALWWCTYFWTERQYPFRFGRDKRMVSAHGPRTGGADWARVALRARDSAGGEHRIDCELSPAGSFVFLPHRERRVHLGVHGGVGGIAASCEDRLAPANDERCDWLLLVAICASCVVALVGTRFLEADRSNTRKWILAGGDELVDRGCGGDRLDRAVFSDLYFAGATAVHGLSERGGESG